MKFQIFLIISMQFCAFAYSTQRPSKNEDESNPNFLEMASSFLENFSQDQGGIGANGIISMLGSMMQNPKNDNSPPVAAQILSSLFSGDSGNGNVANGGFDPSMIGNVLQVIASLNSKPGKNQQGSGLENVLSIASMFLNNYNDHSNDDLETNEVPSSDPSENLISGILQTISSFSKPEMEETKAKHIKDHGTILPPIIEKIHTAWDYFANSELSDIVYKKMGLDDLMKNFLDQSGKVDYPKLFESLQNQTFRKRWIQKAIVYLAEWANYMSDPKVFQSYFANGQILFNGFLRSQNFPQDAQFDIKKSDETISKIINHAVKRHLMVDVDSKPYVKPVVSYIKDLVKLGKNQEFLRKMNTTDVNDKLTDALNLEIIEPILKVYRAYSYALNEPKCDRYVLCEINSHDRSEKLGLGGFKSGVLKFGSYAASWFISESTHTPFWTLFGSVNDPYECSRKYTADCSSFSENEHRVTTEYVHTEL